MRVTIETERLIVRPVMPDEYEACFKWCGDPEVNTYLLRDKTRQSLNTRIFKEWLPGNSDFEISGNANVEWYDCMNGEKTDPDYHSAIWIPVKRK